MTSILKLTFVLSVLGSSNPTMAQDSLSLKMLEPITRHFSIEEGQLVGEGADFLQRETAKAQFTLLGDYPDSKSSSDFTAALLPELYRSEYKTMALGIGMPSARLLNVMAKEPKTVVSKLRTFNNTYAFMENERIIAPMSDMKSIADAQFIQKAGELQWTIVGFGDESWNNLLWLLDQIYDELPLTVHKEQKSLYDQCKIQLKNLYTHRDGHLLEFVSAIKNSGPIEEFLLLAASKSSEKTIMVKAFHNSLESCLMYAQKQFYQKNKWRVNEEKRLLHQELDRIGFDIDKDRLFVKWDMNFLSRGFQPYAFYGVGNTLSEIANYNGNTSLNIGIIPRYQFKNGSTIDLMNKENTMANRLASLVQVAKKDEWTVIDLRQMIQESYYVPIKYLLDENMVDLIKRYDLVVIPALEQETVLNYDTE